MIDIFYKETFLNTPVSKDGKLRYAIDRATSEFDHIKEYYRNRNSRVKNNNMLVSLITTLAPNYDMDIWDYVRVLESTVMYNSKTFGIVSNVNSGYINKNVLFKSNSNEIFLYKDTELDIMEAEYEWMDLKPLRVLRHDSTDLNFRIPSESVDLDSETLTIVEIDLIMLLVQYKYWSLNRLSNGFDTDPSYFVYGYVFTNMADDFMDMAVINRAKKIINNEDIEPSKTKHPFNILDIDDLINGILKKTLKNLIGSRKSYQEILKNIPLLFTKDAYTFLLTKDVYFNKQSSWAAWLSKLPHVLFLLDVSSDKTFNKNLDTLDDIRMVIKKISRENIMGNKLTGYMEIDYDMEIDYIKLKIGER